jgi:N-methylhydantoinase A
VFAFNCDDLAMKIVGVDVGGTFTDLLLFDEEQRRVGIAKVPTTLENQAFGVLAAVTAAGADLRAVGAVVHGTTTTTNALLERKIARAGLVTTRGFRDVLELGRRTRPQPYGLIGSFEPLIPRELRLEVSERIDAEGEVVRPLDEAELRQALARLVALGAEALVIHFLHAYINPAHERRAATIARELWPNPYITVGSELVSEYREYERGVTASVNAVVQPVLQRYIARLESELSARGYAGDLLVMQGNGGTVSARLVSEAPVHTVMSGPASGVIAAAYTARAAGFANVITYDMGGTSSDVALIQGGVPLVSSELELEYAMPIRVPMVDVHSIGAGGGSLARIDDSGMLRVGPESAGAHPGPICFGRGGDEPTITDANLVLGRLNPERLLSVERPVALERIRARLVDTVGARLGLDGDGSAAAILRIANDKMAGAIRMVSLARGHDPRDFALFAFGGAGPLHAAALARELGIPRLLIPMRPGITNALGCVVADLRHDYVRTVNRAVPLLPDGLVRDVLTAQIEEGRRTLAREQADITEIRLLHRADMQFQGQSHLLGVDLPDIAVTAADLQQAFEAAYWRRFGVALPEIRAVLVNLHTAVIGKRRPVDLAVLAPATSPASPDAARAGRRRVWFEAGWLDTPIYRRETLPQGARFDGPAVLEQLDATTVVEPGNHVEVDPLGNLVVTIEGRA